jgi:hypothetical protein
VILDLAHQTSYYPLGGQDRNRTLLSSPTKPRTGLKRCDRKQAYLLAESVRLINEVDELLERNRQVLTAFGHERQRPARPERFVR